MIKTIKLDQKSELIEIDNGKGLILTLSNYGASVYSIQTVDRNGKMELITLSPNLDSYYRNPKYCGLTVGRIAGRLLNGEYVMNSKREKIDTCGEKTLLHSGKEGFAFKHFDSKISEREFETIVEYSILIKDMEDNFHGDFDFHVIYNISKTDSSFSVRFLGTSSKDTILNITNHTYFNLSGDLKDSVLDHQFQINANRIGVLDDLSILKGIKDIPSEFDFRNMKSFRKDFKKECVQNPRLGYDDYFVSDKEIELTLLEEKSGRCMKVASTYKDCVVYTDNYPNDTVFINGVKDSPQIGVAIEPCRFTQILKENGIVQKANDPYDYTISYTFSTRG